MNRKDLPQASLLREMFVFSDGALFWKERPPTDFKTYAAYRSFLANRAGKQIKATNTSGYIVVTISGVPYYAHRII